MKFKSYYVVWKLIHCNGNFTLIFMFKSYYVVWKQQLNRFDEAYVFSFKSYYVVWKLSRNLSVSRNSLRLNRTM